MTSLESEAMRGVWRSTRVWGAMWGARQEDWESSPSASFQPWSQHLLQRRLLRPLVPGTQPGVGSDAPEPSQ